METYIISNQDNTERHVKDFNNLTEARTWVQNHLDMSQSWNCDRLEWIVQRAYAYMYVRTKEVINNASV